MCVGPPAFTALALIGMANGLPDRLDHTMDGIIDVVGLRTMAVVAAVFLWALALWWFFIACIAVISSPPKYFHLGWWAMVFPNTGFILATIFTYIYALFFSSLYGLSGFAFNLQVRAPELWLCLRN